MTVSFLFLNDYYSISESSKKKSVRLFGDNLSNKFLGNENVAYFLMLLPVKRYMIK